MIILWILQILIVGIAYTISVTHGAIAVLWILHYYVNKSLLLNAVNYRLKTILERLLLSIKKRG